MTEVETGSNQELQRFHPFVGSHQLRNVAAVLESVRRRLEGRIVWNINSTAAGGGVAEMLQSLLPYVRGVGIDTRWAVIKGAPDFFRMTKRLHHALHGSSGDGTPLDAAAHAVYEAATRENIDTMTKAVRPRDVVLLHDPQTAGLASHLIDAGALVIWRCHIGHDTKDPEVERGWAFLAPYLKEVPAFVFSRESYVPAYCDHGKSVIITPSIDAFSPKNQELDEASVREILAQVGMIEGPAGKAQPAYVRQDGSAGLVARPVDFVRVGPPLDWETPLVVQVSRWDPLKDPVGVMQGFATLVDNGRAPAGAELVLAGPNVSAVADDPESAQVFEEVCAAWRQLPEATRRRIHLAALPMDDVQENGAIVNALQRHATVVVQKSLQEGFGLTVTEALWKARPVVASAVGGIQDQIVDGEHGILLSDPADLDAFAAAVKRLLEDPNEAQRLGENARVRVAKEFLGFHHLLKYAALIEKLDTAYEAAGRPTRFAAP